MSNDCKNKAYKCWSKCSLVKKICLFEKEEKIDCIIKSMRKQNESYAFSIHPINISSYRLNIRLWIVFLYENYYLSHEKGCLKSVIERDPNMLTNALKVLCSIKYNKEHKIFTDNEYELNMFLRLMVFVTGLNIKELMNYIKTNYKTDFSDDFINMFFIEQKQSTIGIDINKYIGDSIC